MKWHEPYRKQCRRWNTPGEAHELTFSCFRRQALLTNDRSRGWLTEAVCRAMDRHEFAVWAYVLMPEHVHLLIWPRCREYSTSAILKSIKQSVSRKAIGRLRRESPEELARLATGQRHAPYRFWLDGGGYDRNIRSQSTLRSVIEYIHANPVRGGLVQRPQDWAWSSWHDWHEETPGPIPIDRESCGRALA